MKSGLTSGPPAHLLAPYVLGFLYEDNRAWLFVYQDRSTLIWNGTEFTLRDAPKTMLAAMQDAARVLAQRFPGAPA